MRLEPGQKHRVRQYEIEQRDGYYLEREVMAGGKRVYIGRVDGWYDVPEPEPKAEPVQVEQPVRKETFKETMLRREEHDSNMRDAGFYGRNGVYIRNPNPSH